MFGNSSEGGLSLAVPDVVKVPPLGIPAPLVNLSNEPMGVPFCVKVLLDGTPAHNFGTHVPLTVGDAAGAMGGVVSGIVMGPTTALTGSTTVLLCALPATKMTSQSLQNGVNAVGVAIAPSQLKVMLLAP